MRVADLTLASNGARGVTQAPSLYDPTVNPEGGGQRRSYVLAANGRGQE